ncbi:MAG TPA: hypothetical protein VF077_13470 [Nitrospiraceae bacterium]
MLTLFSLSVQWDGTRLIATPVMVDGWRAMTGEKVTKLKRVTLVCTGVDDATQFEVGMFLATACREFTDAWERKSLTEVDGLHLFDSPNELVPGE